MPICQMLITNEWVKHFYIIPHSDPQMVSYSLSDQVQSLPSSFQILYNLHPAIIQPLYITLNFIPFPTLFTHSPETNFCYTYIVSILSSHIQVLFSVFRLFPLWDHFYPAFQIYILRSSFILSSTVFSHPSLLDSY